MLLCLALAVGSSSECAAQTPQPLPSVTLTQQCRVISNAAQDVKDAMGVLQGDDYPTALVIYNEAILSLGECFTVRDLFFVGQMLSPGNDRKIVVAYVRERKEIYAAALDLRIAFLNRYAALINPARARSAESIRDKVRVLADLFRQLDLH
jgi:hypothetical protein